MTEPLDPDVLAAMMRAMPQSLQLNLTAAQAVALIGQLRLALQHPQNSGPSAEIARDVAALLQAGLRIQNPDIEPYLNAGSTERPYDFDHC